MPTNPNTTQIRVLASDLAGLLTDLHDNMHRHPYRRTVTHARLNRLTGAVYVLTALANEIDKENAA